MRSPSSKRYIIFICILLFLPKLSLAFDYLQPLPKSPPIPANNPQTDARIALGKKLFFDTRLLGSVDSFSCNYCHTLANGGSDNNALSIGQNGIKTRRSAPGLWNIGLQSVLYWDGRSASLEYQILDHLRDPVISSWKNIGEIVSEISKSTNYRNEFEIAFINESDKSNSVSGVNIAKAIASFERSLITGNNPFDRYITGDESAISASAKRGITLFNETGCLACHFGANFSGPAPGPALKMGDGFYELFPNNLGTDYEKMYMLSDDSGLYEYTGLPDEKYMWRVPTLRNIELTAPYFHNGSVSTLKEAIRVMAKTQSDKTLSNSDVNDIAEFLKSLTATIPSINVNGHFSQAKDNDQAIPDE